MAKITFEDKNAFAGQPFNQLKAAEVNEIKESVNALYDGVAGYLVVTELPATIPQGVQLLYNGTMYRRLLEGESSLAAGTPWPVKGYKEYEALVTQSLSNEPVAIVVKNTSGLLPFWQFVSSGVIGCFGDEDGINPIVPSEESLYSIYTQSKNTATNHFTVESDGAEIRLRSSGSAFNFYIQIKYYPPAP